MFWCYKSSAFGVSNAVVYNDTTHKLWFVYLEYSLEEVIGKERATIVWDLLDLKLELDKMMTWCFPDVHVYYNHPLPNGTSMYIDNRMLNIPCGYVQVHDSLLQMTKVSVVVQVIHLFYVHLLFLVFKMDDSGALCEHSACRLMQFSGDGVNAGWNVEKILCGHRKPWNQTMGSNRIAIDITQRFVQKAFNLTFVYFPFDKDVAKRNILLTSVIEHRIALDFFHEALHLLEKNRIRDVRKWIIMVNIGFRIHFTSIIFDRKICTLKVFDGPQSDVLLNVINSFVVDPVKQKEKSMVTVYFQSLIDIHCEKQLNDNNSVVNRLNIRYRNKKHKSKSLELGKEIRIQSNHGVIHKVFAVRPIERMYPNISIIVHKFHGWNDGGCNFGGYTITQHFNDSVSKSQILGPFCSRDSSHYVKPHGLDYYILGSYITYITIYAFGPNYNLDVNLRVGSSICEGVLEPILMLLSQERLDQSSLLIGHKNLDNAHIFLSKVQHLYYKLTLSNLTNCLAIQSLSTKSGVRITYLLVDIFKAYLKFVPVQTYLDVGDDISTTDGFIDIQLTSTNHGVTTIRLKDANFEYFSPTKIAAVTMFHIVRRRYEHLSFTLQITKANYSFTCSKSYTTKDARFIYAPMAGYCGALYSQYRGIHFLTVMAKMNALINRQTFVYLSVANQKCHESYVSRYPDILTVITNKNTVSHSVDFFIDQWHFQSHDSDFQIHFLKKNTCSYSIFQYKIEAATRRTFIGRNTHGLDLIQVYILI